MAGLSPGREVRLQPGGRLRPAPQAHSGHLRVSVLGQNARFTSTPWADACLHHRLPMATSTSLSLNAVPRQGMRGSQATASLLIICPEVFVGTEVWYVCVCVCTLGFTHVGVGGGPQSGTPQHGHGWPPRMPLQPVALPGRQLLFTSPARAQGPPLGVSSPAPTAKPGHTEGGLMTEVRGPRGCLRTKN